MSNSPDELTNETSPIDADLGTSSEGSSSSAGSSSTSGSGSTGGGASRSSSSSSSSSDSRRVAPKWLGKKIGRFRLQGLLGQGAAGRVFRAEDNILHRRVALKVITMHGDDGQINRNADQFLTEARAAAALEHPNVVQIYEAGETGNLCYIAMELLDGGSLKDLVAASGPMDPGRACLLTADAAEALAAGHDAGIVHRDVKPANLMLSRQGRCKVTDFGLATFGDADSVSTERAAGTPLFAAPEVIRGTSADERSDIYSLGATLFYLLTGRPPFMAKTRGEVLRKHVNEPIPDLRTIRPGLPESLVAAVERAMDKDPGRRFESALQFARVLRVQTIPAAPLPTFVSTGGETIGGASVLNLSGLTAVSGSSSGRLAAAAGGRATAADLAGTDRRPARAGDPAAAGDASPPPTPRPRPKWRSTAALAGLAGAAVVLVLVVLPFLRDRSTPATPAPPPVVAGTPAAPPPAPAELAAASLPPQAPAPTAVTVPTPVAVPTTGPIRFRLTATEATPVSITDLVQLTRIATGQDPARPHRYATVVGTVTSAGLSPTGNTVRLAFAGTPFVVVYFDRNGLYQQMADKFGGPNGTGLAGKTIRVAGLVKMHNGQPEIEARSTVAIRVLADPAGAN